MKDAENEDVPDGEDDGEGHEIRRVEHVRGALECRVYDDGELADVQHEPFIHKADAHGEYRQNDGYERKCACCTHVVILRDAKPVSI